MLCVQGDFGKKGKIYKRTRLGSKLTSIGKDFTLEEAAGIVGLEIPKDWMSCACNICTALIGKYAGRKTECDKLKKEILERIQRSGTSGGVKRMHTPSKTPRKVKRIHTGTSPAFTAMAYRRLPVTHVGTSPVRTRCKLTATHSHTATSPIFSPMARRTLILSTPRQRIKKSGKGVFRQKVVNALRRSHYKTVLNLLLESSAAAKVAFHQVKQQLLMLLVKITEIYFNYFKLKICLKLNVFL